MARKLSSYPLKNRIWAGVGMVITFVGAIALLGMYAHLGWWVTLGQAVAFILNVLGMARGQVRVAGLGGWNQAALP